MDQSTFCQQESQEIIREDELLPSCTKDLVEIKLTLLKIANNVVLSSYVQMREIRKQYASLCTMKTSFKTADLQESLRIKDLLFRIKETHPEIYSKEQFVKTGTYKSLYEESSNVPSQGDKDVSRNVMSSSVVAPTSFKKPSDEQTDGKLETLNVKDQPSLNEEPENLGTDDVACQKIRQYLIWAVELRQELKKQSSYTNQGNNE